MLRCRRSWCCQCRCLLHSYISLIVISVNSDCMFFCRKLWPPHYTDWLETEDDRCLHSHSLMQTVCPIQKNLQLNPELRTFFFKNESQKLCWHLLPDIICCAQCNAPCLWSSVIYCIHKSPERLKPCSIYNDSWTCRSKPEQLVRLLSPWRNHWLEQSKSRPSRRQLSERHNWKKEGLSSIEAWKYAERQANEKENMGECKICKRTAYTLEDFENSSTRKSNSSQLFWNWQNKLRNIITDKQVLGAGTTNKWFGA